MTELTNWARYRSPTYDELIGPDGKPRPAARALTGYLSSLTAAELADRRLAAELAIKSLGITFTVYSEGRNVDRAFPFDVIPRTIERSEWDRTEAGLKQRVTALNCFIADIYG
ncbi:MAG: circularly permuted type 2 ATP-grasp protein, partial [Algiphilus sp.]